MAGAGAGAAHWRAGPGPPYLATAAAAHSTHSAVVTRLELEIELARDK